MTNSTFNFSVKLMPFSSLMTVICKLALRWFFFVFTKKWPSHGLSLLKLRFQHISADFPKFITIYYDYQSNIIAKKGIQAWSYRVDNMAIHLQNFAKKFVIYFVTSVFIFRTICMCKLTYNYDVKRGVFILDTLILLPKEKSCKSF